MMLTYRAIIAALPALFLCPAPVAAQLAGPQTVRFFDSETGLVIEPRQVTLDGNTFVTRDGRFAGAFQMNLTAGDHIVQAFASGYRDFTCSLRSFDAAAGAEAMVDPVTGPPEFAPETIRNSLRPDSALVIGFVGDDVSGQPLQGVRVAMLGTESFTNERGFFSLRVPVQAGDEDASTIGNITFAKDGYRTGERRNVDLYPENALKYRVRLQAGTGTEPREDRGAPIAENAAPEKPDLFAPVGQLLGLLLGGRSPVPAAPGSPGTIGSSLIPEDWKVPASIRVGRDCKTPLTCAAVEVLSLDHYCKRVLPSEWIPAWKSESLKAGSVAVRTYVTWYHNSRSRASFDICDNPSCQYFGPRTYFTTDLSVDSTSTAVLTNKKGIVVKAEYSAENNDTGCGDGKTGDCVDDPVCAGTRARGHGRGLCQKGSQRWAARGKDWKWILEHYYPSLRILELPAGGR